MVGVVFLFFSANLTEKSVASFPLLACLSEALSAITQPLRSAYAVIILSPIHSYFLEN
jgi:hypothetical protein